MKINQNQTITSRTEFLYYAFRNILLVGLPLVVVSEDLKEKTIWYKLPDGWIEESSIYICNNQFQAKTAAKKITGDQ